MTLPQEFQQNTRALLGDDLYERLAKGLAEEPVVSIRLNANKWQSDSMEVVDDDGQVAWCKDGYYLKSRPNFTFDPLLHAGLYYVQDASSMFVDYVIRQIVQQPVCVLDLCAAPGGKSIAVRNALPEGSLLVSNEPMRLRANVLAENLQKNGHPDVIVTNNFPHDYRKSSLMFDVVLADVPCSGEGMFRKDSGAVEEWSEDNVEKCWQLQREIITDIWPCLKPGGWLIYSTCTFNNKENEANIEWIATKLGADIIRIPVKDDWNIVDALGSDVPAYRFLPGITRGEGLFLCILRKHGETEPEKVKRRERPQRQSKELQLALPLQNAEQYECLTMGGKLLAFKRAWHAQLKDAMKILNVIHAGIVIGEQKGKNLIPDQSLALSIELEPWAYPKVAVDYLQAIAYLRKETITLPDDAPHGYVLLTYLGVPLGFAKNLGSRANNLYPQPWRIKSTHIPDKEEIITIK